MKTFSRCIVCVLPICFACGPSLENRACDASTPCVDGYTCEIRLCTTDEPCGACAEGWTGECIAPTPPPRNPFCFLLPFLCFSGEGEGEGEGEEGEGEGELCPVGGLEPAVVFEGDYVVQNELELQALIGVEVITGSLTIDAPGLSTLVDLASLRCIENELGIMQLEAASLAGLNALQAVGALSIASATLGSLEGLSSLAQVPGTLRISTPTTFAGAGSLLLVGELDLAGPNAPTSLAGLSGLTNAGAIRIVENPGLSSLDGLARLSSVGTLEVRSSPAMATLSGAPLAQVGALILDDNASLASLPPLAGIAVSAVSITNNAALSQCEAELFSVACGLRGAGVSDNAGPGCFCAPE